jgi:hypothetical protein
MTKLIGSQILSQRKEDLKLNLPVVGKSPQEEAAGVPQWRFSNGSV